MAETGRVDPKRPIGETPQRAQPEEPRAVGERRRSLFRNPFVWAFFAGIITITLMRPLLRREPPPPPVIGQLPEYSLVDSSGQAFGSVDLAGQVYVTNFIFTRCTSICPLLTRAMGRLQQRYDENGVEGLRLVSITVDPEYDTPGRLRQYAESHDADPGRWVFLTGDPERIRQVVEGGFKTAVGEAQATGGDLIDIAHSGKFVLVDGQGGIRGYYDSDELGLDEIYHRSLHVLEQQRR